MKKLIFVASLLFVAAGNLFAQPVTLFKEITTSSSFFTRTINFTGFYARVDSTSIDIYDESYNLVKSIVGLPANTGVSNVSKNLFTTSGKYEFILTIQNQYRLYNEDKQMLYDFEGYTSSGEFYGNKMHTYKVVPQISQFDTRIYTIQGQMESTTGAQGPKGDKGDKGEKGDKGDKGDNGVCNCNNPSTAAQSISSTSLYTLSDPYPNPTFSYAKLDYNVGMSSSGSYLVFYDLSGVKRLSVMLNSGEGTFEVSKSIIGTGVFMYRIEGGNGAASTCKKLVIE